jgi:alpha-1,3/alpha-1,6-mannosyltransferase
MYTSHYEPARSFAETRDGSFRVVVSGDWLPRQLLGGLHILFAILRAVWLAAYVAATAPADTDVFVCDQVAAYVPVLRALRPRARVLFYCHFPDQLLSRRGGLLKSLYRAPFDAFEAWATAAAHEVVVNSAFTRDTVATVFARALRGRRLDILYPCIAVPPAVAAMQG